MIIINVIQTSEIIRRLRILIVVRDVGADASRISIVVRDVGATAGYIALGAGRSYHNVRPD